MISSTDSKVRTTLNASITYSGSERIKTIPRIAISWLSVEKE